VVVAIDFAGYGVVQGSCGSYTISDTCSSNGVVAYVTEQCLGKASCMVPYGSQFGDPCANVLKMFAVQVCDVPAADCL
jgi:hypothetical protein